MPALPVMSKDTTSFYKKGEPQKRLAGIGLFFRNVVVMNGGISKITIIRTNRYIIPFLLATGVIYVGKTVATIERTITNTCNAIGNSDTCKV